MNNDEPPVTFPVISPQDYETDAEFINMYRYLTTNELTGNARADKTTLIMADKYTERFVISDGLAPPEETGKFETCDQTFMRT